jgi:protein-tyrosine phosphatase
MAEAIFNSFCNHSDLKAISAGAYIVKDSRTSKNSAQVVKENLNIDLSNRRAVQINENIIESCNLILTMTGHIRDMLIFSFPKFKYKICTLSEYVSVKGDVSDPFGGDIGIYRHTYSQLKNSILLLLDRLREEVDSN